MTSEGHTQFRGQRYCPESPGQVPQEEWLALEEAKAKALTGLSLCELQLTSLNFNPSNLQQQQQQQQQQQTNKCTHKCAHTNAHTPPAFLKATAITKDSTLGGKGEHSINVQIILHFLSISAGKEVSEYRFEQLGQLMKKWTGTNILLFT